MIRTAAPRPVAGALVTLALLSITPLAAAELRLDLDPGATRITFELGATLHAVEGTAELGAGHLTFDPDSGVATGRIVVAASSLTTGHADRDRKMHSRVLESATFPDIIFEPSSVSGEFLPSSESRLVVDGTLIIHGDAHSLSLEVVVRRAGENLTATSGFAVPYVAWGMKDPSRFVMRVAKEVEVRIEATGRLAPVMPKAQE